MRKLFKTVIAASVVTIAAFGMTGCAQSNRLTDTCTVEDKDRTRNSDGGSEQRIYMDCGVFKVADNMIEGQWNSADLYQKLDVGTTYNIETIGWRNGFLSLFPNIVKAEVAK